MHWDSSKLKPLVYRKNCFGVNFTTDIPEEVTWLEEIMPESGNYKVKTLVLAAVARPDNYPLLIDLSDSKGDEILQILESVGGSVGLCNSGKAHGYFLDGSARELNPVDLKAAGFSKIYDNSTRLPKVRTL